MINTMHHTQNDILNIFRDPVNMAAIFVYTELVFFFNNLLEV